MAKGSCPIWGTDAQIESQGAMNIIDSPRTGGIFEVTRVIETNYFHNPRQIDDHTKARLTTWLIDQRRAGIDRPRITEEIIQYAKSRAPLRVHDRANRLLIYIKTQLSSIGDLFEISIGEHNDCTLAWTESLKMSEVKYLLDYLQISKFIENNNYAGYDRYAIAPAGYAHLEANILNSHQAFVAMWFDYSMNEAYENGIAPGIEEAGYTPTRIDKKNHNNKIDDEIIAEIRRSRFLVADFTQGASGARGGVYYEAGFAQGLNIPVIFTCKSDSIEKVHFDTRQYNHVTWDDPKELKERLAQRISATLGDGPLKKIR